MFNNLLDVTVPSGYHVTSLNGCFLIYLKHKPINARHVIGFLWPNKKKTTKHLKFNSSNPDYVGIYLYNNYKFVIPYFSLYLYATLTLTLDLSPYRLAPDPLFCPDRITLNETVLFQLPQLFLTTENQYKW